MDQQQVPMLEVLDFYRPPRPAIFHIPGHGGRPPHPALGSAEMWRTDQSSNSQLQGGLERDQPDEYYISGSPEARARQLAAELWGARSCWWLFGGASQGNHALLLGSAGAGDLVLAGRGSHLSVSAALVLSGAQVRWTEQTWDADWDSLSPPTPQQLQADLDAAPQVPRGVLVTSPTYFGRVADIEALAEVCHRHELPLWVDGSWGSHFGFHPQLPPHPLQQGADVLLLSTHKHAGSLRGSAMLLAADTPWMRREQRQRLQAAVDLLQTTSPNFLMRLSLDAARWQLAQHGEQLWGRVLAVADQARQQLAELPGIRLLDMEQDPQRQDYARLVLDVSPSGWNGRQLQHRLMTRYRVLPEMGTDRLLVLMLNHASDEQDLQQLLHALQAELAHPAPAPRSLGSLPSPGPECQTPRQAALGPVQSLRLESCVGHVAAEAIAVYPPGIPAVLPGCRIQTDTVDYLLRARRSGAHFHGCLDRRLRSLRVVSD